MFVNLPFAMAPGLVLRMPVCGQMMFDAYMAFWPVKNEYSDQIELICCTMTWNYINKRHTVQPIKQRGLKVVLKNQVVQSMIKLIQCSFLFIMF